MIFTYRINRFFIFEVIRILPNLSTAGANSRHDDQIDSMSQALYWAHENQNRIIGFSKKHMEEIDRISKQEKYHKYEKLW